MAAAQVARPIGISRNPVIKTNFLSTLLSFCALRCVAGPSLGDLCIGVTWLRVAGMTTRPQSERGSLLRIRSGPRARACRLDGEEPGRRQRADAHPDRGRPRDADGGDQARGIPRSRPRRRIGRGRLSGSESRRSGTGGRPRDRRRDPGRRRNQGGSLDGSRRLRTGDRRARPRH